VISGVESACQVRVGAILAAEEEEKEDAPPQQEFSSVPGPPSLHGGTPSFRERPTSKEEEEEEEEETMPSLSGWLWKKAGGGKESSSSMFSGLTGRNWKRRWFSLERGVFGYWEEPTTDKGEGSSGGRGGFIRGSGLALWSGDLRDAGTGVDGSLRAHSGYDPSRKRAVLSVGFGDRLLTLGTPPGEQNAADLSVLAAWEEALNKHHAAVTALNKHHAAVTTAV